MLNKDAENILKKMERMGFAGAGEALHEIERQQVTHKEYVETASLALKNAIDERNELQAEIERLRENLKKEQGRFDARLSIKEAKIEQLRENRDYWMASCQEAQKSRDTASVFLAESEAEIERLRKLLLNARDDVYESYSRETKPHRIISYRKQLADIDKALGETK